MCWFGVYFCLIVGVLFVALAVLCFGSCLRLPLVGGVLIWIYCCFTLLLCVLGFDCGSDFIVFLGVIMWLVVWLVVLLWCFGLFRGF